MEPAITTDIVIAYAQCPLKAYLLLFSPDTGEPHEYVQILEQQRCANQKRYLSRLQQTHADVQPYSLDSNSRFILKILYDLCRQALAERIACPRRRV